MEINFVRFSTRIFKWNIFIDFVETYFAVLIAFSGPWMVTIRLRVPGEKVPFLDI